MIRAALFAVVLFLVQVGAIAGEASAPAGASESLTAAVQIWNPAAKPELRLAPGDPMLRIRERPAVLEVLVHRQSPAPVTLRIAATGPGGRTQAVVLAETGWQRVVVPTALLQGSGAVADYVLTVDGDAVLHLAASGHPAWPNTTGITDAQFLDHLDLDRPELALVRDRLRAGDRPGALAALVHHFRTRRGVSWTLPSAPAPGEESQAVIAVADRVVRGEFTMLSNQHTYPGGLIDWTLDPTVGTPFQTNEWIWSMGRHEIASKLLAAAQATRDPAQAAGYCRTWAQAMRTWVAAMPKPAGDWELPGSGWRGLDAGLRMGEFWPNAWFGFIASPEMTDDDVLTMAKSFWEHGEFLFRHVGKANHQVVGLTGAYVAAVLFPEFRESPRWRRTAAEKLQDFVVAGCDGDAGWYERSPSYHLWLVQKMCLVFNAARVNGCAGDFTPAFRDHVRRMAEWSVHLAAPDRVVPSLNDSTRDRLEKICAPAIRAELPGSRVLEWGAALAAGQVPEEAPLPTSELLTETGYAMMRTSWRPEASYLLFDVGPMGGWHGHLDALNLVYAPDGAMTVFDTTGGTYSASPFRTWAMSTASHNAVLVDGLNQHRPKDFAVDPVGQVPAGTPAPVFTRGDGGVYACGWHVGGFGRDARAQVRQRREIAFRTADGVVVVVDTLTPDDAKVHAYDLRWQLQTAEWRSDPEHRIILPQREGRTLMAVVPLGGEAGEVEVHADSGVTKPEILGWDVVKSAAPVPALTVRHLRRAAGPTRFVTALIPGSLLGTATPRVSVVEGGWRIDLDGRREALTIRWDDRCQVVGGGLPGAAGTPALEAVRTAGP